ncbi:MAG: hypothetical protein WBN88_06445, partial [Anderseniella sp.]
MKDVKLRVRELRDKFMEACRNRYMLATQVLREFMRDCVATQKSKTNEEKTVMHGAGRRDRKTAVVGCRPFAGKFELCQQRVFLARHGSYFSTPCL